MYRLLTFPILAPILLGLGLLIWHPVNRRVRSIYIMAACLLTSALSFLCIVLTYQHGGDLLACILVRFSEAFSISLRIDGASMVYGAIVSCLWPLVTVYALDYMSHEGHESRFFAFWLIACRSSKSLRIRHDFVWMARPDPY